MRYILLSLVFLSMFFACICAFDLHLKSFFVALRMQYERCKCYVLQDKQRSKRKERKIKASITVTDVAEMLDILTLALNAGLSFDAAIKIYHSRIQNSLAHEMCSVQKYWEMGITSKSHALVAFAEAKKSEALQAFAQSVEQSLEFGCPLADILSHQAEQIRIQQRLQTEEAIEKVPVKLLLPLAVFVIPAMFLAILGPILSVAMQNFF